MDGESDISSVARLQAGGRIGPYELLRPIGQGGFAVVWLARLRGKHGFERLVAIKTIRPELVADVAFEKMFIAEARITAAIDHHNVVRVLDFGDERDILYLVMEYVAGDSLSALRKAVSKRHEPFPCDIALGILEGTCAGLHAAHQLNVDGRGGSVVHRDVSPQNVLVTEGGIPKLVDFGIAKACDGLAAESATGAPKGKLRYMAPEQVMPHAALDCRADVWAVGAIAYELLEGRPALDGPNDMARMHALISGQPFAPFTRDVPPAIAEVIFRALSFDREARFATALEMGDALRDALAATGRRVTPAGIAAFCADVLPHKRIERAEMRRTFALGSAPDLAAADTVAERVVVADVASAPSAADGSADASSSASGAVLPPHPPREASARSEQGTRRDARRDGGGARNRLRSWAWLTIGAAMFVLTFVIATRRPAKNATSSTSDRPPPAAAPAPVPTVEAVADVAPPEAQPRASFETRAVALTPPASPKSGASTARPRAAVRPPPAPRAPSHKRVDDEIQ